MKWQCEVWWTSILVFWCKYMCLVSCFHRAFDQDNVVIELVFNLDYTSTSFPSLDSHLQLVSPMLVVQDSNPTSPTFSTCIQLPMLGFVTHKHHFSTYPFWSLLMTLAFWKKSFILGPCSFYMALRCFHCTMYTKKVIV